MIGSLPFTKLEAQKSRNSWSVQEPYSLFENSKPLQCCIKKTESTENIGSRVDAIDEPRANPMLLFRDIKFYFVNIAQTAFLLRLGDFLTLK